MRPPGGTHGNRGQALDLMEATSGQYVDDLVDDYVSWREACGAVAQAYENWRCAGRQEQKLAFSEYVAALNREEQAATVYQQAVQAVRRLRASRLAPPR